MKKNKRKKGLLAFDQIIKSISKYIFVLHYFQQGKNETIPKRNYILLGLSEPQAAKQSIEGEWYMMMYIFHVKANPRKKTCLIMIIGLVQ